MKLFRIILRWWIYVVITCLNPPNVQTPRMSPDANYGLWVTMTGRPIDCHKLATPVRVAAGGRGRVWVGGSRGHMGGISVLSAQFCCEPKTALKAYWKKLSSIRWWNGYLEEEGHERRRGQAAVAWIFIIRVLPYFIFLTCASTTLLIRFKKKKCERLWMQCGRR